MRMGILVCGVAFLALGVCLMLAGRDDFLKLACLGAAVAWGLVIARHFGLKSIWERAVIAALVSGAAFGVLTVVAVFMADWPSLWHERISAASYLGAMGALGLGGVAGVVALVFEALLCAAMKKGDERVERGMERKE